MIDLLFVIWLVILPFIFFSGAYEGPKVVWLLGGGLLITLFWTIRLFRRHPMKVTKSGWWLLAWIALLGIASVIGIHPIDSLVGGSNRYQGIFFFFTLFLIGETLLLLSAHHKHILRSLLGFATVVESVIVIEQKLFSWGSQPLGTVGGAYAVTIFLVVGLWWVSQWHGISKLLRAACYLVTLVAIVSTLWGSGITLSNLQSQSQHRIQYWRMGIREVIKRPILGYGAGSEEVVYEDALQLQNIPVYTVKMDQMHNLFLDVALWSGMVGLVVFVGWLATLIYKMLSAREPLRLIVFFVLLAYACVAPMGAVLWVQLVVLLLVEQLPYYLKTH